MVLLHINNHSRIAPIYPALDSVTQHRKRALRPVRIGPCHPQPTPLLLWSRRSTCSPAGCRRNAEFDCHRFGDDFSWLRTGLSVSEFSLEVYSMRERLDSSRSWLIGEWEARPTTTVLSVFKGKKLPSPASCNDFISLRRIRYLGLILGRGQRSHSRMNIIAAAQGRGWDGIERCRWGKELNLRAEMHGSRNRPGRPTPASPLNHILMQGFNWESHKLHSWWSNLKAKVEEIAALGVTDVWLPPASQSVDRQGYLPGELYNLNASKYGTSVELKELIDALHKHGICCLADIVVNHRSGGKQDSKGHWNVFEGGTADARLDWGPWAVVDNDVYDSGGKGHHDTGESYGAAPDLDHTNKKVQDELTDWMNWLRAEVGFDGWRFDFVKGYGPEFTYLYIVRTLPTFAVGEYWTSLKYDNDWLAADQDEHRQELCNWIDGTNGVSSAFDFTTKGILQTAVMGELWRLQDSQGKPPGLMGWYPEKAVTFIDNHDTGSTQRHWKFPDAQVIQGYAYILTHPGTPCIFYDHFFEWNLKDNIKELVDIRKRNRIHAKSTVTIVAAEADIYVANIDDRIIVKLGPRFHMGGLLPSLDTWRLATAGNDYAVWESTVPLPPVPLPEKVSADPIPHVRPLDKSHPIILTSKMSNKTKQRILDEVPELVDPDSREN